MVKQTYGQWRRWGLADAGTQSPRSEGLLLYGILKFVMRSSGLHSVLLAEGHVVSWLSDVERRGGGYRVVVVPIC